MENFEDFIEFLLASRLPLVIELEIIILLALKYILKIDDIIMNQAWDTNIKNKKVEKKKKVKKIGLSKLKFKEVEKKAKKVEKTRSIKIKISRSPERT